ncbi:hypothetical protein O181_039845 [Austropuccinia psidii MF-1]|uniref:Reverse transcriptase domain-containing protein n=1 Tax=Austropuccinia psidii MF-1 TaxID=1389203 RepID=A0A9Q3DC74_9BASI|nr:hypothetical protein [Austropuccinia psidii MF-1]
MALIFTIVKTGILLLVQTRKKNSHDIYLISTHDPLDKLLNEFREGQFSTTLTSKQKLILLKMLRKNRPAFSIGEEPLGKIRRHDIELYLDLERPYPPMLRRPPYPVSLETRNLCRDFGALNNYTKADRYPIPRIPHALDKLAKSKYITKMDCMKGFHQNGVKPKPIKLLRIICNMGIYEYTRMTFEIKNPQGHFRRMMDMIFQEEILEGWMVVYISDIIIYSETCKDCVQYIDRVLSKCAPIDLKISLKKCEFGQQELLALGHKVSGLSLAIDQNKVAAVLQKLVPRNIKDMPSFLGFASYYRNHIKTFAHIISSLYRLCLKDVVFEITKERRDEYERIKHELTNSPVLILPYFELSFKLYIDAAFSQGLGAALHQRKNGDIESRE